MNLQETCKGMRSEIRRMDEQCKVEMEKRFGEGITLADIDTFAVNRSVWVGPRRNPISCRAFFFASAGPPLWAILANLRLFSNNCVGLVGRGFWDTTYYPYLIHVILFQNAGRDEGGGEATGGEKVPPARKKDGDYMMCYVKKIKSSNNLYIS